MISGQKLSAAAILKILGERLSDAELARILPHVAPDAVRDALLAAARAGVAAKKPSPVSEDVSPQGRLFSESGGVQPREQGNPGPLTLYADGAARGNPGPAGAGFVILAADGSELAACGLYLGECTNNVAEYQALISGLEEVRRLGGRIVAIFLDSELIVRQLAGRYKVKAENLKPLYDRARSLLAALDSWRVDHVPRHENSRADALANKGIDSRRIGA